MFTLFSKQIPLVFIVSALLQLLSLGKCESGEAPFSSTLSAGNSKLKQIRTPMKVAYLVEMSNLFLGTKLPPLLLCNPAKLQWSPEIKRHHIQSRLDPASLKRQNGAVSSNLVVCLDHFEESEMVWLIKWKQINHQMNLVLVIEEEENGLLHDVVKGYISPFLRIFFHNHKKRLFFESFFINDYNIKRDLAKVTEQGETLKLTMLQERNFLDRRSDLQGLKMRVVTSHAIKYIENIKGGIDLAGPLFLTPTGDEMVTLDMKSMKGLFIDVLEMLKQRMNLSCHLFTRKDRYWGHQLPNGSWSGMLGTLNKSEADVAIAPFTNYMERRKVISYLPFLASENYALYIKQDGLEEMDPLTFFRTFRDDLWLGILCTVIIICLVLTFFENFLLGTNETKFWPLVILDLGQNLWRVSSSLLGGRSIYTMSTVRREERLSYRLLLLLPALFGVITLACFRSSVTSELSVSKVQLPFNSLEGLLHSDYKVTSSKFYFNTITMMKSYGANPQVLEAVVKKFEDFARYNRVELDDMEEKFFPFDKLAYFYPKELMAMHPHISCRLHVAWETSHPIQFAPVVPKASELSELLTYQIEHLLESGFIHNTNKRQLREGKCQESNVKAISKEKLAAPILLMCIVFVLSPILLICEFCAKKLTDTKRD